VRVAVERVRRHRAQHGDGPPGGDVVPYQPARQPREAVAVRRGGLRAGMRVLVQGTGGVALFRLQIAKAHGAELFVTPGDPDKRARPGARRRPCLGWVEAVHRMTGGKGIDHILAIVGGPHLMRSPEAAAVQGRVSVIGVIEGYDLAGSAGRLLLRMATVRGMRVGHRRALEDRVRAVDRLGLKPVIHRHYSLASWRMPWITATEAPSASS
jgi:NADPH:quinone reductase-like Zn-dependent oxidoreductase